MTCICWTNPSLIRPRDKAEIRDYILRCRVLVADASPVHGYLVTGPNFAVAIGIVLAPLVKYLAHSGTVNSVQRSLYSIQYTVHTAQCTVYSVQCTVYSVQRTLYNVQCTENYLQSTV